MIYRGFEITESPVTVSKGGKQVFTAHWQRPGTIDEAKEYIDMSLKAKEAFERLQDKGAALKRLTGQCELENGTADADDQNRWFERESENQLHNDQTR